jgi:hypothetical protein
MAILVTDSIFLVIRAAYRQVSGNEMFTAKKVSPIFYWEASYILIDVEVGFRILLWAKKFEFHHFSFHVVAPEFSKLLSSSSSHDNTLFPYSIIDLHCAAWR